MQKIRIDNLEDPRLAVYQSLKKTNLSRRADLFVAEGTTLVERLFNSEYEVDSVLVSDEKLRNFEPRIPADTLVYHLERRLAAEIVGYSFHTGVIAAARRKPTPALSAVLPESGPSLILFGDQIIDQQNMGLMIRIASAFGASAVVLGPGCADPFSRRVLRVSMGNGLFMPIIESDDAVSSISELQAARHRCFGTVLDKDAQELAGFAFPERIVMVFGNETHGISQPVLHACESQLTISMLNGTDSLNVAIAMGIFTHAWRSQHARISLKEQSNV